MAPGTARALHLLADNASLTANAYADIRRGIDVLRRVHEGYRSYVADQGLDPEIHLPGNQWSRFYDFESFLDWTYDLVNYVRCLSPFTGFDVMMWGRRDTGEVDSVRAGEFYGRIFGSGTFPADIDAVLDREFSLTSRMEASRERLVRSHAALIEGLPSRYVMRSARRMGELGIIHDGAVINPDLLLYQSEMTAMAAGGALGVLERAIERQGHATVLDIGSGHAFWAWALHDCFGGKLQVIMIDLPKVMVNGYAHVAGLAGVDQVGLVTPETTAPVDRPFVFVPNHLLPAYARQLPPIDLAHNAISLNEMHAKQVAYYLDVVDRHLAPGGVFYMEGGGIYRPGHTDARAAACAKFPRHTCHTGQRVGSASVLYRDNSFFQANPS